MTTTQAMKCENCGAQLGGLEEAYVWLDRPVCKACFNRLSSLHSVKYRGLWMPLAITFCVIAVGLGVALAIALSRAGTEPPPAAEGAEGPSRAEVLAILKADRTWYWHWEQPNKESPFKFVVGDGERIEFQPGGPATLQQRWIVSYKDHIFVPIDSQTIRGFYAATGRQTGAFTDEPPPTEHVPSGR